MSFGEGLFLAVVGFWICIWLGWMVCFGFDLHPIKAFKEWWVSKHPNKQPKPVDFTRWRDCEIKLGMDFASNGVVIMAYDGGSRPGEMLCIKHTRVAHDASEIGAEVMALLAEIQLGK